ncbi:VRR-NUC domain-containing protein [Pseudolactococcus insecticola]|uniref:Nuclease n=1 Tax=Pseudolactococcus insecticola TaxID=2709158 RepID=A0A6A0B6F2_9LACT|nr:VRR-NUC domain-containing protein [Lactococcus insecticola]GFH40253.1 nuclease [Lactococcus insecticola]
MLEKIIEQKLGIAVKSAGGRCLKFITPTLDGVPDRLVLMPQGRIAFVEVKQKGQKPRPLQVLRMKQLTNLGFRCFVLDDIEQIPEIVKTLGGDAK